MNTFPASSVSKSVHLAIAVAITSVLLSPLADAATDTAKAAGPNCVTARVLRHFGPPGKGIDHFVEIRKCKDVDFSAFEKIEPRKSTCLRSDLTHHDAPSCTGASDLAESANCDRG